MPKRLVPLATLRRQRLLIQRALAEKAGIALVAIELGRATPQIQSIKRSATALEVCFVRPRRALTF